jgi:histidinol-phosphate phosphatase family protein
LSRFVFLDRDGTLVRDPGYVHRLEDYELLPGVVPGLQKLVAAGYRLAIVTNQSGIGRGYFRERDFERFQAHLFADLASRGVVVERTYHCPHRPDEGCTCRKPAPGLLERAHSELGADLATSWMIGDSERDAELAQRAGCRGAVLLRATGTEPDLSGRRLVLCAPDLDSAADIVLAHLHDEQAAR